MGLRCIGIIKSIIHVISQLGGKCERVVYSQEELNDAVGFSRVVHAISKSVSTFRKIIEEFFPQDCDMPQLY